MKPWLCKDLTHTFHTTSEHITCYVLQIFHAFVSGDYREICMTQGLCLNHFHVSWLCLGDNQKLASHMNAYPTASKLLQEKNLYIT